MATLDELDDLQFDECQRRAANHLLQAAKELMDATTWAPDDFDPQHFMNVASFCRQEADDLFPSGEHKDGKVILFPGRGRG